MHISPLNKYFGYITNQKQASKKYIMNESSNNNNVSFSGSKKYNNPRTASLLLGSLVALLSAGSGIVIHNEIEKSKEIMKTNPSTELGFKNKVNRVHMEAVLTTFAKKNGISRDSLIPVFMNDKDKNNTLYDLKTKKPIFTQKTATHFVAPNGDSYKIIKISEDEFKILLNTTSKHDNPMTIERYFNSFGEEISEKYREDIFLSSHEENAIVFVKDLQKFNEFKKIDTNALINISAKMGLSNLEVIDKKDGNYNLFFNAKKNSYDVNIKKLDGHNSFVGIATKLSPMGESELYLFKIDFLSTEKTNKLRISHMNVIQDGLDENSPTSKKGIQDTKESGTETTVTSQDLTGKSRRNMLAPAISNIFYPGKNYDGKLSSKTASEIDKLISTSNANGKEVVIYSSPKGSTRVWDVSVHGVAIE